MKKALWAIVIAICFFVAYDKWERYNTVIVKGINYDKLMSMDFDSAFDNFYREELDKHVARSDGFKAIFALAERQYKKTGKSMIIVETGSVRKLPIDISGDGGSTLIFSHFLGNRGILYSVDTDPDCAKIIHKYLKLTNTHFFNMDSIEFLKDFHHPEDINILYLDAADIDFNNTEPAAMHHLLELQAIFDKLREGTIIAVDGNVVIEGQQIGKGYLLERFLKVADGVVLVHDGYQKVFQIRRNKIDWEDYSDY